MAWINEVTGEALEVNPAYEAERVGVDLRAIVDDDERTTIDWLLRGASVAELQDEFDGMMREVYGSVESGPHALSDETAAWINAVSAAIERRTEEI